MKRLYEITITCYKKFYVEANTQEESLKDSVISDEDDPNWNGDFNWEYDETCSRELTDKEADFIRKMHPNKIAQEFE